MLRLSLPDVNLAARQISGKKWHKLGDLDELNDVMSTYTLLGFAARYWAGHFRNSGTENKDSITEMAVAF
jgi:hypothetical protein